MISRLTYLAKSIANENPSQKYNHVAIIFSGGKILSTSRNEMGLYKHAEINAISRLNRSNVNRKNLKVACY